MKIIPKFRLMQLVFKNNKPSKTYGSLNIQIYQHFEKFDAILPIKNSTETFCLRMWGIFVKIESKFGSLPRSQTHIRTNIFFSTPEVGMKILLA